MHRKPGRGRSIAGAALVTVSLVSGGAFVGAAEPTGIDRGPSWAIPTRSVSSPDARPTRMVNAADVAEHGTDPALGARSRARGLPTLSGGSSSAAVSRLAPDVATVGSLTPAAASGAAPPAQISLYNGLDDADNAAEYCGSSLPCIEPPDPWVAAGEDHVIQAVNGLFRVSSRDGASEALISPAEFFLLPDSADGFADPRIIFDGLHGRWVATEVSWECDGVESFGYLDVAWSMTADPLGDWRVSGVVYPGYLPDYPAIGTTTDKILLTANVFELPPEVSPGDCVSLVDTFAGTDIWAVDWANLLDETADFTFSGYQTDTSFFTWRPAVQAPATSATAYLVGGVVTSDPAVMNVGYARLTGTVAAATIDIQAVDDLTTLGVVDPFQEPPDAEDPGGPIGSPGRPVIDGRPTDAVWQADVLTFVSTVPCTPTGDTIERTCARVAQIDTTPLTPTAIQDMAIGAVGKDTFLPGAGVALNGTLHVVYAQSSAAVGISSYAAYQRRGDAPNTISAPLQIGNGAAYTYGGDRWGDYVGVAQDPFDVNAVWQGAAHTAPDGSWHTTLSQLYTPGATYHPVDPVRLLDTRFGNGLSGTFLSGVPRTWSVAGRDVIPEEAIAVTGNVTVTGQTGGGYVSVSPLPVATPRTSTLNFPAGDNRANNVTIPLSAAGSLAAVYKSGTGRTTHLLFDVTGYFTADDMGATYNVSEPVRLLDTRFANGLTNPFVSGIPRTWAIAGRGGIPFDAIAVTANLTVTGQTGPGYVSVSPLPNATPGTSTLNFPLGDNRANGLTVPLAVDGTLSAVFKGGSGRTTHLALDVTGYYLGDLTGARFVPLSPGRRLDTRINVGLAGKFTSRVPRELAILGFTGIAPDAIAVTGNLTVVNESSAGYVSITIDPLADPPTSTLNFPLMDVRANGVTVPLTVSDGSLWMTFKGGTGRVTDLILDVTGYFR